MNKFFQRLVFQRHIFYLLLTAVFIFLWFRLVDVPGALGLVSRVRWSLVVLAVFLGILTSLIGAIRLKILLSIIADLPLFYIWTLGYATALLSTFFPFYVGGFSFAYFIAKRSKSSYAKSFAVIFVDFFLALVIIVFLGAFGLVFFGQRKLFVIQYRLESFILAGVLTLAAIAILILFKKRLKRGVILFSNSKSILLKASLLTLATSTLGFVQLYLYLLAFGLQPPVINFVMAGGLFSILGYIPGIFAKIGQYETFGVLTLPLLLNLDKNAVFAALLLQHAISITLILIVGLASIYYLKINLSFFKKGNRP